MSQPDVFTMTPAQLKRRCCWFCGGTLATIKRYGCQSLWTRHACNERGNGRLYTQAHPPQEPPDAPSTP